MTGLGLKLPHGPHRRPMGGFAAFPSPETSSEARATMARCPRRVQRDSLGAARSEEHTSELQSRLHLVCRLLLEKKKQQIFTEPLVDAASAQSKTYSS